MQGRVVKEIHSHPVRHSNNNSGNTDAESRAFSITKYLLHKCKEQYIS